MKVIHWTPKDNKSSILERGILLKDTWISCSMLTPFKGLNRWWLDYMFEDQECIGIIFELQESDFPLVHGHWMIDTTTEYDEEFEPISKQRNSLKDILEQNPQFVFQNKKELIRDYTQNIIWRIGNTIDNSSILGKDNIYWPDNKKIIASGRKLIKANSKKAKEKFIDNGDFMKFVFEDYEVLLFKNIEASRIERIVKPNSSFPYHDLQEKVKKSL
ncbi:hypothetical protein [Aureibacter tunicatorum]|uniref:Uncharacterized protein n=1 Tax=Aureibacter tunicatorum TaxID=866807 RepID=A0AAE3XN31_9BACT|nr:hypothetical protein [Aureibacter tunicatorum]MDR6238786.1 hypothetical protein [Aureibacter tunicatorum]BDD05284.1 hypothetical protein AUTU_27670 [Aureibacter tunicatorum]